MAKPKDIGSIPDKQEHCIVYDKKLSGAYFCSEPTKIDFRSGVYIKSDIIENVLSEKSIKIDSEALLSIGEEMKE